MTKPSYEEPVNIDRRRIIPAELRRYTMAELQAMQNGPNKRFVCEECDACETVSSGPHHFVCHICWLTSELDTVEAENLRVRGLLQRLALFGSCGCDDHTSEDCCNNCDEPCAVCMAATLDAPSGAESADIGKLDAGDKKSDREMAYRMECFGCHLMLGYANPSGRGDSVNAFLFLCEKCAGGAWPLSFEEPNVPHSSQNQTVSSGVEGAHEGIAADKSVLICGECGKPSTHPWCAHCKEFTCLPAAREPEKLNNAQPEEFCKNCGSPEAAHGDFWGAKVCAPENPKYFELAESSLSSPPQNSDSSAPKAHDHGPTQHATGIERRRRNDLARGAGATRVDPVLAHINTVVHYFVALEFSGESMTREHEVLCDCNFDEGHEPTCAIVAAHKRISDAVRYPWMQGAESADIGKLDTADKSGVEMGKVNRVESEVRRLLEMAETPCERPRQRFYDFLRERDAWQEGDRNLDYGELILKCIKATQAGSAETGGEKAAPDSSAPTIPEPTGLSIERAEDRTTKETYD